MQKGKKEISKKNGLFFLSIFFSVPLQIGHATQLKLVQQFHV